MKFQWKSVVNCQHHIWLNCTHLTVIWKFLETQSLCSSGMLCSLVTNVLVQPICPILKGQADLPLKMGPIGCPETSVTTNLLCNSIQEEQRSCLHCSRSLNHMSGNTTIYTSIFLNFTEPLDPLSGAAASRFATNFTRSGGHCNTASSLRSVNFYCCHFLHIFAY